MVDASPRVVTQPQVCCCRHTDTCAYHDMLERMQLGILGA